MTIVISAEIASVELEEDQQLREEELIFLENLCRPLAETEQNRMRRVILLMLYAHFEGFVKFALNVYCRHINEAMVRCKDVEPILATTALKDVFRALRSSDSAQNFLPKELREFTDLKPLAIERTLVKEAFTLSHRTVVIGEQYIDTESNLKPIVLRKNLYRLGLQHDIFDQHDPIISQLLGRRNNVTHGTDVSGVDKSEYDIMKKAVLSVMNDLKLKVIQAIDSKLYRRSEHIFSYHAPTASSVTIVAEFNDWIGSPMVKASEGVWTASISLALGNYGYKFLVDDIDWVFDPLNSARKIVGDVENSEIQVL